MFQNEVLDFITALFMGNLPFSGHSTIHSRPDDNYDGPLTFVEPCTFWLRRATSLARRLYLRGSGVSCGSGGIIFGGQLDLK